MKTWALLALMGFAALAYGAEMYRWVDEKGVVNYTPYPPPANVKKVEQKKLGDNTKVQASDAPYELQLAVKNFPLTFYTTDDCGELCKTGRAHLDKRGVPYTEKNPAKPASLAEFESFKKMSGGALEVPMLQIGQLKTIKGYLATEWDTALDAAGYPPSAPAAKPGAKPPAQAPASAPPASAK